MYREEALDCLIQCLKNTDFPRCQLLAAKTILSLLVGEAARPVLVLLRALLSKGWS